MHRGQGERGLLDPPNLTVLAGLARSRAWNVRSHMTIILTGCGVTASCVPRAACAALWHGQLPCVVGPSGPGYPEAYARPLCLRRGGGRAPLDDGPLESSRSLDGDARPPTLPLALAPQAVPACRNLSGTPHCVPAGGGRGSPLDRVEADCTYGTVVLNSLS